MSRTQESGAYLGGIGTMLREADVCPACGQSHAEESFGIAHPGPRECPRVVLGSFPVISALEWEDGDGDAVPPTQAGRRIREFETPAQVSLGSLPRPARHETQIRHRSLATPWLRPPDLGEIL